MPAIAWWPRFDRNLMPRVLLPAAIESVLDLVHPRLLRRALQLPETDLPACTLHRARVPH